MAKYRTYTGPISVPALDGAPGFIVTIKDVPKEYWAKHQGCWALSSMETWESLKDIRDLRHWLPDIEQTGGGGYPQLEKDHLVWIPARFIPQENEFGPIAI